MQNRIHRSSSIVVWVSLVGFAFAQSERVHDAQQPAQSTPQSTAQSTPSSTSGPAAARTGATQEKVLFKQEELEQILAPIALYPDDLLAQILMASTYPLEIVQADRWAKANKNLKGDAAAKALEKEPWDASVKSLVALPDLLAMFSEKLDWTQKVGDAFIGQQADVMRVVQQLRGKAKSEGKLNSDENQKVEVKSEGTTQYITIESTNPDVIYVPVYNPTVVYGTWAYPAYPPYPYYPPAYGVGMGIAIGFAWGYAWGGCGWGHSEVDIDIDKNVNRNSNIDRSKYQRDAGGQRKGNFKHNPSHRQGVPYRDSASARQYGGRTPTQAAQARESFRGRGDSLGGAGATNRAGTADRAGAGNRASTGGMDRSGTSARQTGSGRSSSALDGVNRGGSSQRASSSRGNSSRGTARGGGGRGGGGRGGRR